jgi:hypothetical protein
VGKRHRRIRARSATGQVAEAATEKPGLQLAHRPKRPAQPAFSQKAPRPSRPTLSPPPDTTGAFKEQFHAPNGSSARPPPDGYCLVCDCASASLAAPCHGAGRPPREREASPRFRSREGLRDATQRTRSARSGHLMTGVLLALLAWRGLRTVGLVFGAAVLVLGGLLLLVNRSYNTPEWTGRLMWIIRSTFSQARREPLRSASQA